MRPRAWTWECFGRELSPARPIAGPELTGHSANANVIPSTLWSILGILQSPSLTTRVLAETESCLDAATGQIDITALCNKPLLTSIYLESLRLCVATTTARNPINDKVTLGGYAL